MGLPKLLIPLTGPRLPAFERNRTRFELDLRRACVSPGGVAIILANWAAKRAEIVGTGTDPEWRRLDRDVAEAVYAAPVT